MSEDEISRARKRRERRHNSSPAGSFGPGSRKQARIDNVMDRVRAAERRNGPPTPERITAALDMAGLYGPEVDTALGGQEPMVDEWESGERIPTGEQVHALARLTGFPVTFFYMPAPNMPGAIVLCGDDGCKTLGSHDL